MSISTTSSGDRIEDDFVILGSDVVREEMEDTTEGSKCRSESSLQVDLQQTSHTRGEPPSWDARLNSCEDSNQTERKHGRERGHSGPEWRELHKKKKSLRHKLRPKTGKEDNSCKKQHSEHPKAKATPASIDLSSGQGNRDRETEMSSLRGEHTHAVHETITSVGSTSYCSNHDDENDPNDVSKRNRHISQRRSRSTKALADEVKDGSRSTSSLELGQGQDTDTCSEGPTVTVSDAEGQDSDSSMVEIRNMSDHHIRLFSGLSSDEVLSEAGYGTTGSRQDHVGHDDQDDDAIVTSALSDLLGGLDSQIRALCRNLESLARFRDLEATADDEDVTPEAEDVAGMEDGDREFIDRSTLDEERFFDCISPELDGERNSRNFPPSSPPPTLSAEIVVAQRESGEGRDRPPVTRLQPHSRTAWCDDKTQGPENWPAKPSRGQKEGQSQKTKQQSPKRLKEDISKHPRETKEAGKPQTELQNKGGEEEEEAKSRPKHQQTPSPPSKRDRTPKRSEVLRLEEGGMTTTPTSKSGSHESSIHASRSSPKHKSTTFMDTPLTLTLKDKFKVKFGHGRCSSLPALVSSKNGDDDSANVIEVCTESNSDRSFQSLMSACEDCSLTADDAENEGGREGGRGGRGGEGGREGGGGGDVLEMRALIQMMEQWQVLWVMWNNHKRQLRDVLTAREREASRTTRLNEALARSRNVITSLRQQRHDLHQHMQLKEQEFAATLRCHRNETAFLRRKVLNYLDEKKHSLTAASDPAKNDSRLASLLDSLLSVHVHRERYMALDLAKQNKINELKLLVVRQQLAMEEMKEQNADLNHALNTLMQFLPDQGSSPPQHPNLPRAASSTLPRFTSTTTATTSSSASPSTDGGGGRRGYALRGLGLSDVLQCERSLYLPHHSTSPELAAVSVFGIGGEQLSPLSNFQPGDIFDASRQTCHADGDHDNINIVINSSSNNADISDEDNDAALAEELLRELTLFGPGSPDFTLAGVDR